MNPASSPASVVGAASVAPAVVILPEDQPIAGDPRGFLQLVAAQTRTLEQYTLLFERTERRGLFQRLQPTESIRCWFRRTPFSLRMLWLNEDLKYGESTYVAGREDDKIRFVTRWWSPPLLPPPSINRVGVQMPVIWGEARRPLTDFGVERMMERTLEALATAGDAAVITYKGRQPPRDGATPLPCIRIEIPPEYNKSAVQELYIDPQTRLPAEVVLMRADGQLEGRYSYRELNSQVQLVDDDFLLEVERNPPVPRPPATPDHAAPAAAADASAARRTIEPNP